MDYRAYRRQTTKAASEMGGRVVSLAGGYYGVRLTLDGSFAIVCLDLDDGIGWLTWSEDRHGERCCDFSAEEIGWTPLHKLKGRALKALTRHRCR